MNELDRLIMTLCLKDDFKTKKHVHVFLELENRLIRLSCKHQIYNQFENMKKHLFYLLLH